MAVRAYVLIEVEVGKTGGAVEAMRKLAGVGSADSVTGHYDIIATVEVADLDAVGGVVKQIHSVPGIYKTTTCVGVRYS